MEETKIIVIMAHLSIIRLLETMKGPTMMTQTFCLKSSKKTISTIKLIIKSTYFDKVELFSSSLKAKPALSSSICFDKTTKPSSSPILKNCLEFSVKIL